MEYPPRGARRGRREPPGHPLLGGLRREPLEVALCRPICPDNACPGDTSGVSMTGAPPSYPGPPSFGGLCRVRSHAQWSHQARLVVSSPCGGLVRSLQEARSASRVSRTRLWAHFGLLCACESGLRVCPARGLGDACPAFGSCHGNNFCCHGKGFRNTAMATILHFHGWGFGIQFKLSFELIISSDASKLKIYLYSVWPDIDFSKFNSIMFILKLYLNIWFIPQVIN